jgi:peptidyl-prolyl cis-trans isomerase SurA
LTKEALKEAIAREGFKYQDYFELIRDSGSKRDLIDREIRTKVTISDDDVRNYFFNHFSRTNAAPKSFHFQVISISDKSFKAPNRPAMHALAQKAAAQALKDLQKGEPFSEVAKRISDDSSSASGGDVGELTEDQMSPVFIEPLKHLKIGEVSGLIQSNGSDRVHILKLLGVKTDDSDRMEKMKEEIRSQLASKEYQHQIALWLDRQRQSAFVHKHGETALKEIPIDK